MQQCVRLPLYFTLAVAYHLPARSEFISSARLLLEGCVSCATHCPPLRCCQLSVESVAVFAPFSETRCPAAERDGACGLLCSSQVVFSLTRDLYMHDLSVCLLFACMCVCVYVCVYVCMCICATGVGGGAYLGAPISRRPTHKSQSAAGGDSGSLAQTVLRQLYVSISFLCVLCLRCCFVSSFLLLTCP